MQKECLRCKTIYNIKPSHFERSKYCSRYCADKSKVGVKGPKNKIISLICENCGKLFKTHFCRLKDNRKYCSRECSNTLFKTGDNLGELNVNWNGGKNVDYYGYVWLKDKNHPYNCKGYVREHRLVMEKSIGRYLRPEESIHHINFIKDDNRIENLMLFSTESEHQEYHQELKRSK